MYTTLDYMSETASEANFGRNSCQKLHKKSILSDFYVRNYLKLIIIIRN